MEGYTKPSFQKKCLCCDSCFSECKCNTCCLDKSNARLRQNLSCNDLHSLPISGRDVYSILIRYRYQNLESSIETICDVLIAKLLIKRRTYNDNNIIIDIFICDKYLMNALP